MIPKWHFLFCFFVLEMFFYVFICSVASFFGWYSCWKLDIWLLQCGNWRWDSPTSPRFELFLQTIVCGNWIFVPRMWNEHLEWQQIKHTNKQKSEAWKNTNLSQFLWVCPVMCHSYNSVMFALNLRTSLLTVSSSLFEYASFLVMYMAS